MSRLPLSSGIILMLVAITFGIWFSVSLFRPSSTGSQPIVTAPPSNIEQSLGSKISTAENKTPSKGDILSPSELLKQRDEQKTTLLTDEQINEVVNSMERLPYDQVVADAIAAEKKAFEKFIDPMPPELIEAMNQPAPPPLTEAQIQEAVNATNLRYD